MDAAASAASVTSAPRRRADPGSTGAGAAFEPSGVCFDIQRFSIHDGPGIRTTVFLKGCPLACPWCQNPESWHPLPEIRVMPERCAGTGGCVVACPEGLAHGPNLPDPTRCLRCGGCAAACPTGARRLVGRSFSVAEVLAAVERDRPFYDESGGGVTFSGGEPLAQPRFLLACLGAAKRSGLHTAVDTSGFGSLTLIRSVARLTDLFLFDLKQMDAERHLRFTGVPLAPILRNLRELDRAGKTVWLRVPFIPGYTDDEANLTAIGRFASGLRQAGRVHLLPYHRLGSAKSTGLGRTDPLASVEPPPSAALDAAVALMKGFDLDVRVGG